MHQMQPNCKASVSGRTRAACQGGGRYDLSPRRYCLLELMRDGFGICQDGRTVTACGAFEAITHQRKAVCERQRLVEWLFHITDE